MHFKAVSMSSWLFAMKTKISLTLTNSITELPKKQF
jgi:hypothetical protein